MKKLTILLAVVGLLAGCTNEAKKEVYVPQRSYTVSIADEGNWLTYSRVECDSFTMVTAHECILYVDGRKQVIFGELIKPYSNTIK